MRVRYSIRSMLALVAVVAIGIAGEQMRRRRDRCLAAASRWSAFEGKARKNLARSLDLARSIDEGLARAREAGDRSEVALGEDFRGGMGRVVEETRMRVATLERSRAAFERVAARPWEAEPVADPGELDPGPVTRPFW